MVKKLLLYSFLFLLFAGVLQLCNLFFWHVNTTFIPKQFIHGFQKEYSTPVSGLDFSLLDNIFAEPFHYLGHGKQMIALESENRQFVLKLFYPMRPLKNEWYKHAKYWKEYFSLKWILRELFQKKVRLKKLFIRHQLAFEKLQKETGIVFVHLSPSTHISHTITIKDKIGKQHFLDLTNTPFIIQEKAILVPEYLATLFKQNAINEIKEAITALEHLFARRIEEGITDRIQTMANNFGFVGKKPIQIDVGRIHFDESIFLTPEKEYERVLNNFHAWLYKQFPQFQQL